MKYIILLGLLVYFPVAWGDVRGFDARIVLNDPMCQWEFPEKGIIAQRAKDIELKAHTPNNLEVTCSVIFSLAPPDEKGEEEPEWVCEDRQGSWCRSDYPDTCLPCTPTQVPDIVEMIEDGH